LFIQVLFKTSAAGAKRKAAMMEDRGFGRCPNSGPKSLSAPFHYGNCLGWSGNTLSFTVKLDQYILKPRQAGVHRKLTILVVDNNWSSGRNLAWNWKRERQQYSQRHGYIPSELDRNCRHLALHKR
jgi:hypothetical protein